MKKDHENGASRNPRSVFLDLEILRRENRGTDLIDDAEKQMYDRTSTKRTPGVSSPHIEVGLKPTHTRRDQTWKTTGTT